jgi:hypothetical protein
MWLAPSAREERHNSDPSNGAQKRPVVITPVRGSSGQARRVALRRVPREKARHHRETVVAEKVEAMVKLGLANSRMKDFHDVAVLSRLFAFDGALLVRAIRATFARRGTQLPEWPPIALTPPSGRTPGSACSGATSFGRPACETRVASWPPSPPLPRSWSGRSRSPRRAKHVRHRGLLADRGGNEPPGDVT